MIKIDVVEKEFKKNQNWKDVSRESSKYLLSSIDLENENECPVTELNPGDFILSEDLKIRFYNIFSDCRFYDSGFCHDFLVLEHIRDMALYLDSCNKLRKVFEKLNEGCYIIVTNWSSDKYDENSDLIFKEFVEE
ncbi:MAG: hypothetical protein ACOCV1_02560 [Bacillota bacterium]